MAERVYGYMLYSNGQQVPQFFQKFDGAAEAAKTHMTTKAKLRIQTTSDIPMRTWNYDYEIAKWVEFIR